MYTFLLRGGLYKEGLSGTCGLTRGVVTLHPEERVHTLCTHLDGQFSEGRYSVIEAIGDVWVDLVIDCGRQQVVNKVLKLHSVVTYVCGEDKYVLTHLLHEVTSDITCT